MKKFICALAALAVAALTLPLSACNARASYVLKTDENGVKYYVVSCSGFVASMEGEYEIPEYFGEGEDRAPVTEIAQEGFAGTSFTKIIIPKTIKKIGKAAFAHNTNLTGVEFAEESALEEIPQGAFGYCRSLKEISIPAPVKSVGYSAFLNCLDLERVTLPETLTTLETGCFYNTGLKSVTIPNSVTELGYSLFHNCTSLESARIGSGVKTVKAGMFGNCTSLKQVSLPASLEAIEGAYMPDGEFYCGHPFHTNTSLADVYYAGTREQWNALLPHIVTEPVTYSDYVFDNSALINATLHVGAE